MPGRVHQELERARVGVLDRPRRVDHGRAKAAPLTEIAAELSRRLKVPVILSRVMAKQEVTLEFEDLPLEAALQMMAPLPSIHYELQGGTIPICREIFLNAYNEPTPVPKLESKNISVIMQGDTETTNSKDDPLRVSYSKGKLSISVKKQSLSAVLDRIATVMGVNFIMKQDTDATIDLDFKEMPLEAAISYFPPSVHLHVRKDIQRISTVPGQPTRLRAVRIRHTSTVRR
jgi:type II secretory pathway component GspD/PulD (secretin)